ncbi:MAG: hypothetical protein II655_03745, partial [Thermoguttaceae bacterium]|nr:hypothetical protein [Thermoguttaceae bacterium]
RTKHAQRLWNSRSTVPRPDFDRKNGRIIFFSLIAFGVNLRRNVVEVFGIISQINLGKTISFHRIIK